MRYLGGILVLAWAAAHALGYDRFPDDDRGAVPAEHRTGPSAILLWHTGFMGGK